MQNKRPACLLVIFIFYSTLHAQEKYNGMDANLSNIYRLSDAKTCSISTENLTGDKGMGGMAVRGTGESAARELGKGGN